MRKTFPVSFLSKCLFILILFIFHACKKPDTISTPYSVKTLKFLDIPANTSQTIRQIANIIKHQDERYHFIDQLVEKEGYILWDKAQLFVETNTPTTNKDRVNKIIYDSVVLLPLVYPQQKQVTAFLACGFKNNNISFSLQRARMYSKRKFSKETDALTADKLALEFMFLNKEVFGDSIFKITDTRLLETKNFNNERYIKIKSQKITSQSTAIWIGLSTVRCYNIGDDGNQGQVVGVEPGGTADYPTSGWICYSQNISVYISGGDPSGSTSVGADPNSGGGGVTTPDNNHWWWSNEPCPDPNGNQVPDAPTCNGGMVLGWQPLYPFFEVTSNQNPFITPCLYAAKQRIGDVTLNIFSKNLLLSNYTNPLRNWTLHFGESTSLESNGQPVAGQTIMYPNLKTITITINNTYFDGTRFPNSSQEYAASIMLHEILHAFLIVYKETYGLVDFNDMNHHSIMFKNFVNITKDTLKHLFPNLNDTDATALAIEGVWDVLQKNNVLFADMDQFSRTNYNLDLQNVNTIIIEFRKGAKGTKCL